MSAIKLAPSILAADFANLGQQVRDAEQAGADRIHIDVMDGHFVPNLSIGPAIVKSLRPITKLPLEVHLMIERPDLLAEAFIKAGADSILVHAELGDAAVRAVAQIKSHGKKVGIVLNPETPLAKAEVFLPDASLLLIMTVHPGFGGQSFIFDTLDKIDRARRSSSNSSCRSRSKSTAVSIRRQRRRRSDLERRFLSRAPRFSASPPACGRRWTSCGSR